MRRFQALVVACIVAVWSAATASPHLHAYGGHEHAEHQHGPASHSHQPHDVDTAGDDSHGHDHAAEHADERADEHEQSAWGPRFEACDPGAHVVLLPRAAAQRAQVQIHFAVLPQAAISHEPVLRSRQSIAPLDVRAHGPPPESRLPARAPPLTFLA